MALSGTLSTLSLAEIMQSLAGSQASGVLRLNHGSDGSSSGSFVGRAHLGAQVVFENGVIIRVIDDDQNPEHTIVHHMIACGHLQGQSSRVLAALSEQAAGRAEMSGGYSVISSLVEKKELAQADANTAVLRQAEDVLYDLFTWVAADFTFVESCPEEPAVQALLEEAKRLPVTIQVMGVLLESSRRIDEWEMIQAVLPSMSAVLRPMTDFSQDLEYPHSVVLPLIDGQSTCAEIIQASLASRYDTCSIIAGGVQNGSLTILGVDELLQSAQECAGRFDWYAAARFYRHALCADSADIEASCEDHDIIYLLVEALSHCDPEQKDVSYSKTDILLLYKDVARSYLSVGKIEDAESAIHSAEKYTSSFSTSLQNMYIECLEAGSRLDEAEIELRRLAEHYVASHMLDKARASCLKALQLREDSTESLRLLAHVFAQQGEVSCAESEQVCISCLDVNARRQEACGTCATSLSLSCLNCGRTIGVSDSVCIYCGEYPHYLDDNSRVTLQAIAVMGEMKEDDPFKTSIQRAVQLQEDRCFQDAIVVWKEIAESKHGAVEILSQIRELEVLAHDQSVEQMIVDANLHREQRHYYRANKLYTDVLRSMGTTDKRRARIGLMQRSVRANNKRVRLLYSLSVFFLLAAGYLVADNHIRLHVYKQHYDVGMNRIAELLEDTNISGYQAFSEIQSISTNLHEDAGNLIVLLGDDLVFLDAEIQTARYTLAEKDRRAITERVESLSGEGAVDLSALDEIQTLIDAYLANFPGIHEHVVEQGVEHIEALRASYKQHTDRITNDPQLLQKALADKEAGLLKKAYDALLPLQQSPVQVVAEQAASVCVELKDQYNIYQQSFAAARDAMQTNLSASLQASAGLFAAAQQWECVSEQQLLEASVTSRLAQAAQAYKQIEESAAIASRTIPALENFLKEYPGCPDYDKARQRLQKDRLAEGNRQQLLSLLHRLEKEKNWQRFHREMRGYFAGGYAVAPDDLLQALVIAPLGVQAEVFVNDVAVGQTPFVYRYNSQQVETENTTVRVQAPHFESLEVSVGDVRSDWQWAPSLERKHLWSIPSQGAVYRLERAADGAFFIFTEKKCASFSADGKPLWSRLIHSDGLADVPEWITAAQIEGNTVALVEQSAGSKRLYMRTNTGEVLTDDSLLVDDALTIGRFVLYTDELFGIGTRVAFAQDYLYTGSPESGFQEQRLPATVVDGPVAYAQEGNHAFLLALADGSIAAYSEAEQALLWSVPVEASDVSGLRMLNDRYALALFDATRIAVIDTMRATVAWEQRPTGRIIGMPIVDETDETIAVLASDGLRCYSYSGAELSYKQVNAPRSCDKIGQFAVIIDAENTMLVYEGDRLLWSRRSSASAKEAIALTAFTGNTTLVIVTESGAIRSYVVR